MKRHTALALLAGLLLAAASNVSAWWGNNWGWNPYDPWDPRYWMEEFFGGSYYGRGPWGWGRGPWGYGYPYHGGWGHPYYRGWGYPYHGGWGYPNYAGWAYAPHAVAPVQATTAKAEK
jgi:hypothetical protein